MKWWVWFIGFILALLLIDVGHSYLLERRKRRAMKKALDVIARDIIAISASGTVRRSVRDMVAPKEDQS
jgi:hypothetical protein